jgi:hypothetical protein
MEDQVPTWVKRDGKALVLRTTRRVDGKLLAHGGFAWPREIGVVVVPDSWDPRPSCGGGLHGLLWGSGNVGFLAWEGFDPQHVEWQVVEVDEVDLVHHNGKVKFPRCRIVYSGDREVASALVSRYAPDAGDMLRQVQELSRTPHVVYAMDWDAAPTTSATPDRKERKRRWRVPVGPMAQVFSSEVDGGKKMHTVAIDVDHHVAVRESSTPGHHHLFIDVEMSWREYRRLLRVLAEVGIIERGYYQASLWRKATHVRLPWVKKRAGFSPGGVVPAVMPTLTVTGTPPPDGYISF